MKIKTGKGFTLVEVMAVAGIISLLTSIALPNLLRSKISTNDALAKATLKSLSTAAETYSTVNVGDYPENITSLTTGATPPYINKAYCGTTIAGFSYACTFSSTAYSLVADPVRLGISGTTTFTITTGGVLNPN